MSELKKLVPKIPDRMLIDFFRKAGDLVSASDTSVHLVGAVAQRSFDLHDDEQISIFSDAKVYRIQRIVTNAPGFTLDLKRDGSDGADGLISDVLRIVNAVRDDVNPRVPALSEKDVLVLQDLIAESFGRDEEAVAGLFRNPKLFRDVLASHHRQNVQLQQTVLDVGKQAAEARITLEQEFARRRSQLEEDFRRKEAAQERAAAERLDLLNARADELRLREKDLDDRSNTHARRELHKDLKAKIAQRSGSLKVAPETIRNRMPIHIVVFLSSIFLAFLIVFFTFKFDAASASSSLTALLLAGLKPISATVALLGILAWYLRWLNRWFERYADAEFHLKQFELDIDRASWVVEAALEWKLSQDRPMPEHLLETISRNLFSKNEKDEGADMHPADYLASALLGRASALNLKVPGGELSFSKQGLKGLAGDPAAPTN